MEYDNDKLYRSKFCPVPFKHGHFEDEAKREYKQNHFYGKVERHGRTLPTNVGGSKGTGLVSRVASRHGAIEVEVWHDPKTGKDHYGVYHTDWPNTNTNRVLLTKGELGAPNTLAQWIIKKSNIGH